jgi:DNA replication protein DnaC
MTTLEERIGTPLRSRLYEMCKKVKIEGEDYRKHLEQRRFDAATT